MSQGKLKTGKNCNSCAHLEWVDGDHESDSGFTCNKRYQQMWDAGRDLELHSNLERDEYRSRGKRCFESAKVTP